MIPCARLNTVLGLNATVPLWYNKERTVVFIIIRGSFARFEPLLAEGGRAHASDSSAPLPLVRYPGHPAR